MRGMAYHPKRKKKDGSQLTDDCDADDCLTTDAAATDTHQFQQQRLH